MGDGGGADRGGERPLEGRRRRYFLWLPLIIAFAFLLSIILSQTQRIGDLVQQNSAPCPAVASHAEPSLKCQVEQLHKLLEALRVEPVPGKPGQVRVIVPSPLNVTVTSPPASRQTQPARPAPRATPRATPRPSPSRSARPSPRPTPSPSPTCSVYNPITGRCLT